MKNLLSFMAGLTLFSSVAMAQSLQGTVATSANEALCDVLVSLYDDQDNLLAQDLTNDTGAFAFTGLTAGADYRLTFAKNGNALNGVSTFDLVRIARHILGIEMLADNQQWAADVNRSNSISTYDLVLIRRLILGLDSELPTDNWHFDQIGALAADNQILISALAGDLEIDIIGIKAGDVNNSAFPCE
jgi:hypothetical protein